MLQEDWEVYGMGYQPGCSKRSQSMWLLTLQKVHANIKGILLHLSHPQMDGNVNLLSLRNGVLP